MGRGLMGGVWATTFWCKKRLLDKKSFGMISTSCLVWAVGVINPSHLGKKTLRF